MSTTNLGVCMRHSAQPAVFRCRQCRDSFCRSCRAARERDLCATCQEYFQEQEELERIGPVAAEARARARRRPAISRYMIVGLLLLDVLFAATWLVLVNPLASSEIADAIDVVAVLSRAIEENRDAEGRVPADLQGLVDRVPPRAADMIRRGEIVYAPSEDRSSFEVALALLQL